MHEPCSWSEASPLHPVQIKAGNHKPQGHKGPAAAHYSVSESDWVEESDYPQWFQLPFYPSVKYLLETGLSILSFIMGDVSPPLRWAFLTHKHQCHLTKKAHYS